MIASLDPTVPLIADADTGKPNLSLSKSPLADIVLTSGFGGPGMIARTVTQYDRAGIAGLHIEDQIQTKRCGHLLGKILVSREEFLTRIRAAVAGRNNIPGGSDIVIIARTDSLQSLGVDEAIQRLIDAREAGADVGFLEGVQTKEDIERAVKELAPMSVRCFISSLPSSADLTVFVDVFKPCPE